MAERQGASVTDAAMSIWRRATGKLFDLEARIVMQVQCIPLISLWTECMTAASHWHAHTVGAENQGPIERLLWSLFQSDRLLFWSLGGFLKRMQEMVCKEELECRSWWHSNA